MIIYRLSAITSEKKKAITVIIKKHGKLSMRKRMVTVTALLADSVT